MQRVRLVVWHSAGRERPPIHLLASAGDGHFFGLMRGYTWFGDGRL